MKAIAWDFDQIAAGRVGVLLPRGHDDVDHLVADIQFDDAIASAEEAATMVRWFFETATLEQLISVRSSARRLDRQALSA